MSDADIFEPYDRLIEIEIAGEICAVPENNSILRCLQFLDMQGISEAELCWNGECLECQVWIEAGGREKTAIACRTTATDKMKITRLSPAISHFEKK